MSRPSTNKSCQDFMLLLFFGLKLFCGEGGWIFHEKNPVGFKELGGKSQKPGKLLEQIREPAAN